MGEKIIRKLLEAHETRYWERLNRLVGQDEEGYEKLIKELGDTREGDYKRLRKIHKGLRRYGDGVPFMYRYPDLPTYLSIASLVVAMLTVFKILTTAG